MSSSISRLIAAIVREQVGRDGAKAESWRLAALAAREEYSEISDALRQETRLSLALTEQRDEAQAEVERLRDVLIDLRSDMRELAERDHPIARVVYERMCEELGSDTHRDPEPTKEPKREYIVHATVEKRVRLELLADDDQEALDDAAHAALYDDTLDVLDEQVTDTSIVWRGRDKGGEDV